jgi:hypothetical protein
MLWIRVFSDVAEAFAFMLYSKARDPYGKRKTSSDLVAKQVRMVSFVQFFQAMEAQLDIERTGKTLGEQRGQQAWVQTTTRWWAKRRGVAGEHARVLLEARSAGRVYLASFGASRPLLVRLLFLVWVLDCEENANAVVPPQYGSSTPVWIAVFGPSSFRE